MSDATEATSDNETVESAGESAGGEAPVATEIASASGVRCQMSEAVIFGRPGEILLRGWTSDPEKVQGVRISRGGRTLGFSPLNERRKDVSKMLGSKADVNFGFRYETIVTPAPKAGDKLEVAFIGLDGETIGQANARLAQAERFSALEFVYDWDSRQMRVAGCVFPSKQLRGLAIEFARRRTHAIREMFLHRPDQLHEDPFGKTLYSGFRDRIQFVGEGDMRNAELVLLFADGSEQRWRTPEDAISTDPTEASVEQLRFDWVAGVAEARGWFRSDGPVTAVELEVGGQRWHGVPVINKSERIQRQFGFRGPMAQEFSISGPIDASFENPEVLFQARPECRVRLARRGETILDRAFDPQDVTHRWGEIASASFDRRNSALYVDGVFAGPQTPALMQVLLDERPLDQPLPIQAASFGGQGAFSWLHKINGAVRRDSKVKCRFFDAGGALIGDIAAADQALLTVSRDNAVNDLSQDDLAGYLVRHNLTLAGLKAPAACFVLQGSVVSAPGGGTARLENLIRTFRDSGYMTILIDRSGPWDQTSQPDGYRRFRELCHFHIAIPANLKGRFARALATHLQAGGEEQHFKPRGKAMSAWLLETADKGRIEQVASRGLGDRVDTTFNIAAAAIANLMKPRVLISSYAWSGEVHSFLDPSIFGLIDTNDVQALRYQQFQEARTRFGEDAVPNLEKFEVDFEDEARLLSLAGGVIAISREEHAFLAERIGAERVVYAGMAIGDPERSAASGEPIVLFVGNSYEPNIHGVKTFVADQWRRVRAKAPKARLLICGRVADGLDLPPTDGVELVGRVEDLAPYYRDAAVVINPVQFGTGASVKLIEALRFGKAVVSTPVGSRGLPEAEAAQAIVTCPAGEFGREVLALLTDPARRKALEDRAYAFSQTALAPQSVHAELFNLLESKLFYR